ncbi:hypothetical protein BDY21DRAFT_1956 [Lineolata rhizophorae]|uniref:Uncharacterized protein n=1 Tax=Lineolata rhizophorae TaxID=578093 RepID=A0A6A6PEL7_9PEZI|nr:hypothetical protein BDY21DRAFT_1956 [Lineolata rhizophorae]
MMDVEAAEKRRWCARVNMSCASALASLSRRAVRAFPTPVCPVAEPAPAQGCWPGPGGEAGTTPGSRAHRYGGVALGLEAAVGGPDGYCWTAFTDAGSFRASHRRRAALRRCPALPTCRLRGSRVTPQCPLSGLPGRIGDASWTGLGWLRGILPPSILGDAYILDLRSAMVAAARTLQARACRRVRWK